MSQQSSSPENSPTKNPDRILDNIYIIADRTGSMGSTCDAIKVLAKELYTVCTLLFGLNTCRLGVVGDYDRGSPNSHCGGVKFNEYINDNDDGCDKFIRENMYPQGGGGGGCEAYKTLFNMILHKYSDKPGVIILFCDEFPHGYNNQPLNNDGMTEKELLEKVGMIWDWKTIGKKLHANGFKVFTFITGGSPTMMVDAFTWIGNVIQLDYSSVKRPEYIAQEMFNVLYALMGCPINPIHINKRSSDMTIRSTSRVIEYLRSDIMNKMRQITPESAPFIINQFRSLLSTPRGAMALTTSPVLGKFWRNLICGKFKYCENGKYENDCQKLIDTVAKSMTQLMSSDAAALRKWIDESHDDTIAICDLIEDAIGDRKSFQALILPNEAKNKITLDQLLELGRGGDFKHLVDLINQITVREITAVDRIEAGDIPDFVPLEGLSTVDILRLTGHLIKPGFRFSKTVAFIAAILSLNNKYLTDAASTLLTENKSKWINWDLDDSGVQKYPIFWSLNFMRVLKIAPYDMLSIREREFSNKYVEIATVIRNHSALMNVTVPLICQSLRKDFTWKRHCPKCKHDRCFTIFPGNSDRCGLCISLADSQTRRNLTERGCETNPTKINEKWVKETSWVQCGTCVGSYSVTVPGDLHCRPKCYPCREGRRADKTVVECSLCLNKYLSPGGSAWRAMTDKIAECIENDNQEGADKLQAALNDKKFICPRCFVHPKDMIGVVEIQLSEIIKYNPTMIHEIPYTPYETLVDAKTKLWRRVMEVNHDLHGKRRTVCLPLIYKGYTIHDSDHVIQTFKNTLMTHDGIMMCNTCISDVSVRDMVPACGHCQNKMCKDCVRSWYSDVRIGCVVSESNTKCPYCKSTPTYATIKGLPLGYLKNVRKTKRNHGNVCPWNPSDIYASCAMCLNIVPALARECAQAAPDLINYNCDDCQNKITKDYKAQTKDCPSCGVTTEKTGGCNHITCRCRAHWCWTCNERFDYSVIYNHMAGCGGVFPDGFEDDYDYDDDEAF